MPRGMAAIRRWCSSALVLMVVPLGVNKPAVTAGVGRLSLYFRLMTRGSLLELARQLLRRRAPQLRAPITTEAVIIGAGPAGLFQVFELGLLGIKAHVLDSLPAPGGQCTELYPDKPIYDIPALPFCGAQELVDRLLQQIKPFGAEFHLGEEAVALKRQDDGRFRLVTNAGTVFDAGAVVIAAGVGSFQPRRLSLETAEQFEGSHIHYRVKTASDFH